MSEHLHDFFAHPDNPDIIGQTQYDSIVAKAKAVENPEATKFVLDMLDSGIKAGAYVIVPDGDPRINVPPTIESNS